MTKKERMYQQIEKHGNDLNKIFNTNLDSIELCKKLFHLETKVHKAALDYCNGYLDSDQWAKAEESAEKSLDKILGFKEKGIPVFINGDARGYALKIDSGYVFENGLEIVRDFGGYGILAPEFDGN